MNKKNYLEKILIKIDICLFNIGIIVNKNIVYPLKVKNKKLDIFLSCLFFYIVIELIIIILFNTILNYELSQIIYLLLIELNISVFLLLVFINYKIKVIKLGINNNLIEKILYFGAYNESIFYSILKYIKTIFYGKKEYINYLNPNLNLNEFIYNKYGYYYDSIAFQNYLFNLGIKVNHIYYDNLPEYKNKKIEKIIKNKEVLNDILLFKKIKNNKYKNLKIIQSNREKYLKYLTRNRLIILQKIYKYFFILMIWLAKYFLIGLFILFTYIVLSEQDESLILKNSMLCIKNNDKVEETIGCMFNEKQKENIDLILTFLERNNNSGHGYKHYLSMLIISIGYFFLLINIFMILNLPTILVFNYIFEINKKNLINSLDSL